MFLPKPRVAWTLSLFSERVRQDDWPNRSWLLELRHDNLSLTRRVSSIASANMKQRVDELTGPAAAHFAFALVLCLASVAHAHPKIDQARRSYEQADFDKAFELLGEAESAETLTRAELATLYELRALVHLGLHNYVEMETDLERLVLVDPDRAPNARMPPDLARALSKVRAGSRGPLEVQVAATSGQSGVTLEAALSTETFGVVNEIRLFGRRDGTTEWVTSTDGLLLVPASTGEAVQYYAEAVGPGGQILAHHASAKVPKLIHVGERLSLDGAAGGLAPNGRNVDTSRRRKRLAWGIVGAALVAGAVVAAVLLLRDDGESDTTRVQPEVTF